MQQILFNETDEERLLRIEEVALFVGVSVQAINIWYRWKRQNPDNEYANLIPDYIQETSRSQRFWKHSDIWALQEFRNTIPRGCKGILGSVTQKYRKKGDTNNED